MKYFPSNVVDMTNRVIIRIDDYLMRFEDEYWDCPVNGRYYYGYGDEAIVRLDSVNTERLNTLANE